MATTTPIYLHPRSTNSYTVAWLCAIPAIEMAAAVAMLDHEHEVPRSIGRSSYNFGDLHGHNVVIASMPSSQPGKVSAQRLVSELRPTFPNLKIYLFVGIGGGVPCHPQPEDPLKDVRLGDVVVGWPEDPAAPAVIQHDLFRRLARHQIQQLRPLNQPKHELQKGLTQMILRNALGQPTGFAANLRMLESRLPDFKYPGREKDVLFKADYEHPSKEYPRNCVNCDPDKLVERVSRQTDELVFHRSSILSGDTLEMCALERDELSVNNYNAKCIEMEAAGVMDDSQCLVIRGICDYADSHKDSLWQPCAAARAAAFAREYLGQLQPEDVRSLPSGFSDGNAAAWLSSSSSDTETNPQGLIARPRIAGVSPEKAPPAKEISGASSNDTSSTDYHSADFRRTYDIGNEMYKSHHSNPDPGTILTRSLTCFTRAHAILAAQTHNTDPNDKFDVCLRLLQVERKMAVKFQPPDEAQIHLQRAESFGREALQVAGQTEKRGAEAQTRLELAFTSGRKATLGAEGGGGGWLKRMETMDIIKKALQELKAANPDKAVNYQEQAQWWIRELSD